MNLLSKVLREECPEGTTPVYDGGSGLVIACNPNPFTFGDAEGSGSTIGGIAPSSTPLDYANYESGQVDAFEEARTIFNEKFEQLKSGIPNIWNYLLVLALASLLGIIVFSMMRNRKGNEPKNDT